MSERNERVVRALDQVPFEYSATERARMLGEISRRKRSRDRNVRVGGAGLVVLLVAIAGVATRAPRGDDGGGALADGSRVTAMAGDARWVVQEVTPSRVKLDVATGRVRFQVSKRPERDFVVSAGDVEVRVVGTTFVVDVTEKNVIVEVSEGRVRVRRNGGDERFLTGGETLVVDRTVTGGLAPAEPVTVADPPLPLPQKPAPDVLAQPRRPTSTTAPLKPAPEQPPAPEAAPPAKTFDALVAEGEAMKREGRTLEAARRFETAVRDFPTEPRRAVVAFSRAKLLLQELHQPGAAAEAFAELEHLSAPASLLEDALAREVEAWAEAGAQEKARARGALFLERYPASYRRSSVQKAAGLER